jgi:drug/metabolite transporter (DMT)-like permease
MTATVSRRKTLLADAGLFYAAAIWGSTFIVVKGALEGIDPVIMVGYRFLIAGAVLLGYLLISGRPVFQGLGRALFISSILWLLYIPQTVGLKYTTASNSGFITGMFVLFIPVFLRTIFRKQPSKPEWIASGVSLAGLWILTGGMTDVNIGDLLTVVAAMTYALHVLYSDRYMKAGVDPFMISCQQFLIVGFLSLMTGWLLDLPFSVHGSMTMWSIIFLALLPTLSAFVIQMVAQRFTTPVKVSLIFAFEPVFAALFAWTLGNEQPIFHRAMGGLLIFFALIISGISLPKKGTKKDT